jgi:hypothetical protein
MLRLFSATLIAAVALSASVAGLASADVTCGWAYTSIIGSNGKSLPAADIAESRWQSQGDYYARRKDGDGTITYSEFVDAGFWLFDNCGANGCSNPYRSTNLKNAGGGPWLMEIWSITFKSACY